MLYVDDTHYDRTYFDACFAAFEQSPPLRDCRGKRFAVCLSDPAYWLALCLYLKERGGSAFPLPVDTPLPAARRRAERSGSHFLLFGSDPKSALENIEVIHDPQGTTGASATAVLVQMSSGTTGEPKYIERSWSSIDSEINSYVQHFDPEHTLQPIVACPISHSYGLICGVLVALKRGVAPIVIKNLNPKYILRKLHETPAHLLYSSPTLIATITMLAKEAQPLHAVMTSGTLMQKAWFDNVRRKVKHLHQQYGCSETGCVALGQDISAVNQVGIPLPHVEVLAGPDSSNPQEIMVRLAGETMVHTRDLGYFKGKQLYFLSRMDDMINVSGLNVYPGEVEEVVMEMPQVTDAVVYRRSHGFGSDQVCLLYVSPDDLGDQTIRAWCAQRLASHQVPMQITRVDTIPRLPNGKVSRRALAEAPC